MWRQMQVDEVFRTRIARALFAALVRRGRVSLAVVVLCGVLVSWLGAQTGNGLWAAFALAFIAVPPVSWWRTATAHSRQLPLGSWVAYAVTPDGAFHASSVVGTSVINPGHVRGVEPVRDCWLIGSAAPGVVMLVPRELVPDADADRLRARRP